MSSQLNIEVETANGETTVKIIDLAEPHSVWIKASNQEMISNFLVPLAGLLGFSVRPAKTRRWRRSAAA